MKCIVTAGPTFEPLDQVRRLTNFSTGRLGTELGNFLAARGHDVTLLLGQQATYDGPRRARQVQTFTTTADLAGRLQALAAEPARAVFHAAAVSDFTFGKVYTRNKEGELVAISSGKLSTRQGPLLAELVPTPKILPRLRGWFPNARLIGWKYDVEGARDEAVQRALNQIAESRTDACVVNGPAYGPGYGLISPAGNCLHLAGTSELFEALAELIRC
ncbi:MAG TPA: phosphopantothenoylcysteine decarboxylase [Verrucomicrobiota bacterium]|nr:phosphopantothenoylcysteine decarboxylase [Verrucomicrobiota bacterium]HRT56383.1 phosphopantothenoylcysteine decarboxylase [Candidatus Paceibacterota bacterium]